MTITQETIEKFWNYLDKAISKIKANEADNSAWISEVEDFLFEVNLALLNNSIYIEDSEKDKRIEELEIQQRND